jgi:hypothetical protein
MQQTEIGAEANERLESDKRGVVQYCIARRGAPLELATRCDSAPIAASEAVVGLVAQPAREKMYDIDKISCTNEPGYVGGKTK